MATNPHHDIPPQDEGGLRPPPGLDFFSLLKLMLTDVIGGTATTESDFASLVTIRVF